MKNTLIVTAEQLIANYAENTMQFLKDYINEVPIEDYNRALSEYATKLSGMLSKVDAIAFKTMQDELKAGGTMMMFSADDFEQIEKWYETGEGFWVAVFRKDGAPFGLLHLQDLSW
jgi:hypothetical protein